ncbi:MAG: NAD-dependent epimerase/dehydratase family protein, partial [Lachnospiraceae bacterium]|nr:NAD-dependent epimerase/dehydratase family protein [Lachnospiraceae bacterium]
TITTNVIGANHLLSLAATKGCQRFVYASSVEVYGENRGDVERFDEHYLGYIDCNTMRAGYPESKRTGEALCQAYLAKYGLDVVIVRFARTYGPTLLESDTKAISQFIHKGVDRENIVLKSEGNQLYSYSYVADAAAAFLYSLLYGRTGEAYNVADEGSDVSLKDLAQIVADYTGKLVVFELPDAREKAGYSTATKAMLDASKLRSLGWNAHFDMKAGIERTIEMLSKKR